MAATSSKGTFQPNDLKSIEDACDEIALFDDDEQIPYLVGEKKPKKVIEDEIKGLKAKCTEVREVMSELKAHLYGKFGSHINLEADEE
ncbi:hypothetical protein NQ314_010247 [Rhamnusium bicolor]|uniref:Prefoldin subunit 4 n=1 Tax=Rhamnusium bicolor TaxID=1586634 RepID=A0AAV8XTH4_9CUCU|nr:hypothetical protein NQ314_010247 [Rhamnusium bicolor]